MTTRLMHQSAPYPDILADLLDEMDFRRGWMFTLADMQRPEGCSGLTLLIALDVRDSGGGGMLTIHHPIPVPAVVYDRPAWMRWLLEVIGLVETHERMECLRFGGELAFPPDHAPGANLYVVAPERAGPLA